MIYVFDLCACKNKFWGYWEQFVVTKMEFSACDAWMYAGFVRIE